MIQDIFPEIFHNEYTPSTINENSIVFCFNEGKVLCKIDKEASFPTQKQLKCCEYTYLFNLSGTDCFLLKDEINELPYGFTYEETSILRSAFQHHLAFAGITAQHIYNWYNVNRFCGKCGNVMKHNTIERMVECTSCGNQVYPRISPVVIVGVTNGDKLLMARGKNTQIKRYGLVAGFIEIGETAEQAVMREVLEETGIHIKNIRYYKSQPWGLSESLLLGFYADLDGDEAITVNRNELSEAVWVSRKKIENTFDNFSLTNEMICHFKGIM